MRGVRMHRKGLSSFGDCECSVFAAAAFAAAVCGRRVFIPGCCHPAPPFEWHLRGIASGVKPLVLASHSAVQLELKLLQEKIFGVETERQDSHRSPLRTSFERRTWHGRHGVQSRANLSEELWQKQRRMGEQFESAWEAATAEVRLRVSTKAF